MTKIETENLPSIEQRAQLSDHRLEIRTTDAFGDDCREISRKTGLKLNVVINDILSVGFKSVKALLADGKNRVVVSIKDGRLSVESFNGKTE